MTHEKTLYNLLKRQYPAPDTETPKFSVHHHEDFTRVYHRDGFGFVIKETIEDDDEGNVIKDYFFDDCTDEGFSPISAKEALKLFR